MIFAMPRRCTADWQRVCSSCSEFADCCADFAQMASPMPAFGRDGDEEIDRFSSKKLITKS
jgi:hypothetical protein